MNPDTLSANYRQPDPTDQPNNNHVVATGPVVAIPAEDEWPRPRVTRRIRAERVNAVRQAAAVDSSRTQETWTARREGLIALFGELEPNSTCFSETAPAWWLEGKVQP